jgi:mono/diheme cytochrome c family protein
VVRVVARAVGRSAATALTIGVAALVAAIALRAQDAPASATVKDKVYTKAQATRGQEMFTRSCVKCHRLDPKAALTEGPDLGGDAFLTKWDGKSVHELAMSMRLSMPPDGSITLTEEDTAMLVAYLLQANGFPDGEKPLKADASAKTLLIVKSK